MVKVVEERVYNGDGSYGHSVLVRVLVVVGMATLPRVGGHNSAVEHDAGAKGIVSHNDNEFWK